MNNFKYKLLEISFPKFPAYEQAGNYLKSQLDFQEVISHYSYEWNKPRHDPELHYSASQRCFAHVKKLLEKKRELARNETVKLDLQWQNLEKQEKELRKLFENISSFLWLNQDKRTRAQFVLQEELKNVLEKSKAIDELQTKTVNNVLKAKHEMEEHTAMLRLYEKFLYDVCKISTDFKNPYDIIKRFESLWSTKHNLTERQNNALEELEMARSKTSKILEENRFQILGLNNILANLNKRYNVATSKTFYWEAIVLNIKKYMLHKYQEINEVRHSGWNIYLLMCKRKHETPKINKNNFEKQLMHIKTTLYELETIANNVKINRQQKFRKRNNRKKKDNK